MTWGMDWIRTMPIGTPAELAELGKTYITDAAMRTVRIDLDYRPALEQLGGDAVLVDWDIAVGPEDIAAFSELCELLPDSVAVAPYRLYPCSSGLPEAVWAHRSVTSAGSVEWVAEGQDYCDLFGFGLVYLPHQLVMRYLAEVPGRVTDATFSEWHYQAITRPVPIHWNTRPVHLHFRLDGRTDIQAGINRWAI